MTWIFWTIIACCIWTLTRLVIYDIFRPRRGSAAMPRKALGNDLVDVSGEIRAETERAWRFYNGSRSEWVPKSQCEWDSESGTMTMPQWLALEKGFI